MFTNTRGALPLKKRVLKGRRLVVVDIENVVRGGCRTSEQVEWARAALGSLIDLRSEDHVVIGVGLKGLLTVGCTWDHVRHVARSGPGETRLELLDVLGEGVEARFDTVVIASGAGIFTTPTVALTASGVAVLVVAHRDGLSNRLRLAASEVRYLPHFEDTAGQAAAA